MKYALLFISIFALLPSCALLKTRDCASADWEKLGRQDANAGVARDNFEKRKNQCANTPSTNAAAQWKKGYDQKIGLYCQKSQFFYLGKIDEAAYETSCPASLREELKIAYETGTDLHRLRLQRENIKMRMLSESVGSERYKHFDARTVEIDNKIAAILANKKVYTDSLKK